MMTTSRWSSVGARHCSTYARKIVPFTGPSITNGATIPSWRSPTTRVMVFQWRWGISFAALLVFGAVTLAWWGFLAWLIWHILGQSRGDNAAALGSNGQLCCCAVSSGAWASLVGDRFLVHERGADEWATHKSIKIYLLRSTCWASISWMAIASAEKLPRSRAI